MNEKDKEIVRLSLLNEELENYFRNTIIPQLFIDSDLLLRKFTPPAMKQFNLKEEYIGLPLRDIQENFRFPTIISNIRQVISSGVVLEKEIQTPDMRWYQMNILPYIIRKDGRTNGVIITFVEITGRIIDLKEQEKLIVEHELLLDTIAHDIKNPLLGLRLSFQMLKENQGNDAVKFSALLKDTGKGLIEMERVIKELVKSRWQGHKYQAVEEILDLQNILEDVRLSLAPQIAESGAIIKYEIGISEVTFARRKLRSIIYNLMLNAIKYRSDRELQIFITSSYQDGYLVVCVADNGIGIAVEDIDSIFEKFYRLDENGSGHGMGLYLVRQALESAGGKITVDSQPGEGSVFRVYLPVKHDI